MVKPFKSVREYLVWTFVSKTELSDNAGNSSFLNFASKNNALCREALKELDNGGDLESLLYAKMGDPKVDGTTKYCAMRTISVIENIKG